jgi:hypothetical protein
MNCGGSWGRWRERMSDLLYRGDSPPWTCSVTKVSGLWGFLVTAYPTDAIKIGDTVWTRSS